MKAAGLALSCACTPTPLSGIVIGETEALLVTEMLPEALPAVVGANLAAKEALFPGLIVTGMLRPLMLNPVPDALACVIVTGAFPVFCKVMFCGEVLPTPTLPKETFAGLAEICGCAAVPDPLSAIANGDPGALLVTETVPVAGPADVGANFAVNEVFWPGVRVTGVAGPVMLKPAPEAVACEIVILAVPEFVRVTDKVPLLPTTTLPKLPLGGLAVRFPCVPVPPTGIANMAFDALLAIVILPEALPVLTGANCAVNVVPWPAGITSGVASPRTLKPVPVVVTPEIVVLAFPEFASVMVCVPVLPTTTLPKAALPGLALKVELCVTPLPERAIVCGDPVALSVNEMLPIPAPVDVGENCALNDTL